MNNNNRHAQFDKEEPQPYTKNRQENKVGSRRGGISQRRVHQLVFQLLVNSKNLYSSISSPNEQVIFRNIYIK